MGRKHKACCFLTLDEHKQVKAAAEADDRTVSGWLRIVAVEELARLKRGHDNA